MSELNVFRRKSLSLFRRAKIWAWARRSLKNRDWNEAQLSAYRMQIGGRFPEAPQSGYILACCDPAYLRSYGIAFLLSINHLEEAHHVHLHLCDADDAAIERLSALSSALHNVGLTFTYDTERPFPDLPYRSVYYAASRFLIAHFLQQSTSSLVLCTDIDGIFRASPWPSIGAHPEDTGLFFRLEQKRMWRRVLACAVTVRPSDGGGLFLHAAARAITRALHDRPPYHVDQASLYAIYRMSRSAAGNLTWYMIPSQLSDYEFLEDGIIWTAKGGRKLSLVYERAVQSLLDEHSDPGATAAG